MSRVCKYHSENPVTIYQSCVGCELQYLNNESERMREALNNIAVNPNYGHAQEIAQKALGLIR